MLCKAFESFPFSDFCSISRPVFNAVWFLNLGRPLAEASNDFSRSAIPSFLTAIVHRKDGLVGALTTGGEGGPQMIKHRPPRRFVELRVASFEGFGLIIFGPEKRAEYQGYVVN